MKTRVALLEDHVLVRRAVATLLEHKGELEVVAEAGTAREMLLCEMEFELLITGLNLPGGIGVRVDTHAYQDGVIPPYYDSLVAKLITHGRDRAEAIQRMKRALDLFVVEGIHTSIPLGPGTLAATADLTTSAITGSVSLPAATGSFSELGFVPVTATTEFIENGQTTGTLESSGGITATSHITLKLTSLKVAGIPVPVGNSCQTASVAVCEI